MSTQNNTLPDNPQIEVIKSGKTGLFTNYIYKAIPLAFDESMSYYETLCGLLNYLKNVILPTVNNNADAVSELQTLYEELRTYVDDYFKDLDVQEEINNKLDDMTEDGTLTNLIKNYVDPIYQAYEEEINNEIDEINNKVDSVASGSPAGVYETLSDLETDDPNHDKIYLVSANGKWYYYNTSQSSWVEGGVYQASSFPEVTDIRDAYYNYTYDTAGNSVRAQCEILNEKINDNMNYKNNVINYFNPKNIVEGYWINNITQQASIEALSYLIYNFVEIDRPGYYSFKWPNQSIGANSYKISLFDKNKVFVRQTNATLVGNVDGNNTIVKLLITNEMFYKQGVRYLGYNQALNNMYNLMVVYGETYPDTYIDYNAYKYSNSLKITENQINVNKLRVFNKIFCAGDSLTAGTFNANNSGHTEFIVNKNYSYPEYMKKILGVNSVNWGIGGESTKTYYEKIITETISPDYDSVIIMLGANDTRENDINVSKLYYQNIINFFKNKYKNIKIFCCTLIPAYREQNPTFYDSYNQNVVKYCVNNNTDCYLVDLSKFSICHANSVYAQGHLTAIGYLQLAKEISGLIDEQITNNINDFKYVQFIHTDYSYNE